MIELRWLERREVVGRPDLHERTIQVKTSTVLQYRTGRPSIYMGERDIWSDWQDVPHVSDEVNRD